MDISVQVKQFYKFYSYFLYLYQPFSSRNPSSVVRTMKIPEHHMAYPSEMLKILAFARIFLLQNFFFCDIIIVLHSTLYAEVFHGIFFT